MVFLFTLLIMAVFFGVMGLAGWTPPYIWLILLVTMVVWVSRGPCR